MNTPISCSDPVTEGILIKSLCNANNSELPVPNIESRPNGSLKGISNALMIATCRKSNPRSAKRFMMEIPRGNFNVSSNM